MENSYLYNNSSSSSAPKMERKYIEKNRRCQMKTLYFKLTSLLPRQHAKEGLALPDKIDEAVKYIQSLQVELEKYKDKKEKLMSRKREHSCITNDIKSTTKSSPCFEIHEMGPDLDMVLVNGLNDSFISFNEIIHVLHQQGSEVVQASFSNTGNSVFHILHPSKCADPTLRCQATANISRRLNELIFGTCSSYLELDTKLDIWDFEIIDFL
ncbi:transcription factor bHLH162-like [Heracleum sosnowskyi]|uniref:Transcription factor bHLH162-like n=1 Tax=Heracleum sosnowskyi TaxID=360622 RepID=A0AAD8INT3_9APIA|nr:transcription factor bHLH162-like [Heracleum sosnowskyi]